MSRLDCEIMNHETAISAIKYKETINKKGEPLASPFAP
jgi:hypothetical protein